MLDKKRLRGEGRWFGNSLQQQEYQVILELSGEIPVKILCKVMGINRSNFYYMILHSDHGSVYASKAYNELLPMYVNRSMSRAGTPMDNAAMESLMVGLKLSCLLISM